MKINRHAFILLFVPLTLSARETTTPLPEFIEQVIHYSPEVKASLQEQEGLHQDVRIARSGFLPKLDFEALDTSGFPASTGGLGISGVMGSPFRVGTAAGFTLQQNIWDFGRTLSDLDVAKSKLKANDFTRETVLQDWKSVAANAYFNCARETASAEVWKESFDQTEGIHKEVVRYTQTGQRSVVDEKLSLLETETSLRKFESSKIRQGSIQNKIRILTGDARTNTNCMGFDDLLAFKVVDPGIIAKSPRVLLAQARIKVAESELGRAKSDYMPELIGFASVGLMDNRRLVNNTNDYSLGIGLKFPIFEGLKTDASVARADASLSEKKDLADAEVQQFELQLENLKESIKASETELAGLYLELKHAKEAYQLAKTRYFKLQGNLLDLREAQRAMTQVKIDLITLLVNYHYARAQEAILSRVL